MRGDRAPGPTPPPEPSPGELLQIMDTAERDVAIFSGIKAKYLEAGWSQRGAEQMVLAQLQAVIGSSQ